MTLLLLEKKRKMTVASMVVDDKNGFSDDFCWMKALLSKLTCFLEGTSSRRQGNVPRHQCLLLPIDLTLNAGHDWSSSSHVSNEFVPQDTSRIQWPRRMMGKRGGDGRA